MTMNHALLLTLALTAAAPVAQAQNADARWDGFHGQLNAQKYSP